MEPEDTQISVMRDVFASTASYAADPLLPSWYSLV